MDFSTYFINRFTDFAGIRYGGLPPKICRAVLTLRHTARRQKLVCVSIHGTTHVSHKPFLVFAVLWNSAVTVTTAWRQGSDWSRLAVYSTAYNAWREKKKNILVMSEIRMSFRQVEGLSLVSDEYISRLQTDFIFHVLFESSFPVAQSLV